MEGGRVNHSWCTGVGVAIAMVGWMCWLVNSMRDNREMLKQCEAKTLMTPPSKCAALARVKLELVGLPGKALKLDTTTPVRCPCSRMSVLRGRQCCDGSNMPRVIIPVLSVVFFCCRPSQSFL